MVVVGSGFGGAVAACRLAQAGCDVLVLERGRWYRNDFPRRPDHAWLWDGDQGPFDLHVGDDVTVVRAAGVGGGSLLYSNVHLRMPADAFAGWPKGWSRAELDPYYDLVAAMLDLHTIDESTYWPLPPRTLRMGEAAAVLGAGGDFFHPPLAVDFGDPREVVTNAHGVEQSGCRHCGKCSVGCNHGAKNSLDKNYLPEALCAEAEIRAQCEVTSLAARPGAGYRVEYLTRPGGDRRVVEADTVVLAAGAIGTTSLLLAHRDELGGLSDRLGEDYSANGDVVTVSLGIAEKWKPTVGPAITAGVLAQDDYWFLVEDGGVPPVSVLGGTVRSDDLDPALPYRGWMDFVDHTAILLGMGREPARGRLRPGRSDGVDIDWPYGKNRAYYDEVADYHDDVGRALEHDGQVDLGPLTRIPVTVHSLGGAVMADHETRGVVDQFGKVFGAEGLYVLDGAAVPTATGVNPSHTIAAVAERNAERLARKLTGNPTWRAPGFGIVPRHHDPLPTP